MVGEPGFLVSLDGGTILSTTTTSPATARRSYRKIERLRAVIVSSLHHPTSLL